MSLALDILKHHAGGRVLQREQKWVLKAMQALEASFRDAAREDSIRRFRLEMQVAQLTSDLANCNEKLMKEREARRRETIDAAAQLQAIREQHEMLDITRTQKEWAVQSREDMLGDLKRTSAALCEAKAECEALRKELQRNTATAEAWQARALLVEQDAAEAWRSLAWRIALGEPRRRVKGLE